MDLPTILSRLDEERRTLARDGELLTRLSHLTRLQIASSPTIIYSRLSHETADAAIVDEIAHHRELNVPFEWKVYAHDAPPDLLERLRRRGLTVGPREAVLVYDLSTPDSWPPPPPDCTVVRIDRPEQIADYRRVAEEVFDKNYDFTATELAKALAAGSADHRGYVAYAGPDPVSAGRLYTHPESLFAGLYGGGTRASYRGRGYYRALVAARARDAVESGARYLQVDALPTSRPTLERLGFQWLTDTWPCEWRPD